MAGHGGKPHRRGERIAVAPLRQAVLAHRDRRREGEVDALLDRTFERLEADDADLGDGGLEHARHLHTAAGMRLDRVIDGKSADRGQVDVRGDRGALLRARGDGAVEPFAWDVVDVQGTRERTR